MNFNVKLMLLECFYDYQTSEIGYQTEFTWKSNEFFILLSYTIKLTYVYWIVKSMRNDFYFFVKYSVFIKHVHWPHIHIVNIETISRISQVPLVSNSKNWKIKFSFCKVTMSRPVGKRNCSQKSNFHNISQKNHKQIESGM